MAFVWYVSPGSWPVIRPRQPDKPFLLMLPSVVVFTTGLEDNLGHPVMVKWIPAFKKKSVLGSCSLSFSHSLLPTPTHIM